MKKKVSKAEIAFLFVIYLILVFVGMHYVTAYYELTESGVKVTFMDYDKLTDAMTNSIKANPLNVDIKKSGTVVFIVSFAYWIAILYYFTSRKNLMPGREHGSAHWSDPKDIKNLKDKDPEKNIILTATESLSINMRRIRRNANVLIIGGSGSGKTRFFLKPNLMQMHSSYVITDPKGEILRSCGKMLKDNGYRVSVLNLVDMDKSDGYNPFAYLREGHDEDVMTLINTIMQNTDAEPKNKSGDPFWEKAEMLLLQSLFYYLIYEAPSYEQNIPIVMELIRAADVREDDEDYVSDLDILMSELREKDPGHIAVLQYDHFKSSAGKTAKSIIISVAARLGPYNIKAVSEMSKKDSLSLSTIGEEKTALFVVMSPANTTFNFIAAMMYTQLFAELDYVANWKHGGTLPILVRFLLDEFANIGKIPNFEKILAYARSLGVGICPIFQSISQLKEMYKDSWETVVDNCDTFLFLGGQSPGTLEYISKKLGNTTIETRTTSVTKGRNSSSSENYSTLKRELMTIDEIGDMPDNKCILFIKGKKFYSNKYDITKHKNYSNLDDYDKKNAYEHVGTVSLFKNNTEEKESSSEVKTYQDLIEESDKIMNSYIIKDLEISEEDVNDLEYEVEFEEEESESTEQLEDKKQLVDKSLKETSEVLNFKV